MDIIIEAIEQAGFSPLTPNEEDAGAFEAEGLRFGWEAKDGEAVFYTSCRSIRQPSSASACSRPTASASARVADTSGFTDRPERFFTPSGRASTAWTCRALPTCSRILSAARRPSSGRRRNSAPLSPTRAQRLSRARCFGFDVRGHSPFGPQEAELSCGRAG